MTLVLVDIPLKGQSTLPDVIVGICIDQKCKSCIPMSSLTSLAVLVSTMSMRPRPKEKVGKITKTDLSTSLTLVSSYI